MSPGEGYRLIQPAPNVAVSEPERPKRHEKTRNNQACNECRKSRIKCDGRRPICATCTSKNRACTYVGAEGQTRIEATKHRLELLEQIIDTLHSGSSSQVAQVLDGIRSNEDLASVLGRLADASPNGDPSTVHRDGARLQGVPLAAELEGAGTLPSAPSKAGTHTAPPTDSEARRSSQSTFAPSVLPSATESSPASNAPTIAGPGAFRITLPDADTTSRAIREFFTCSGSLFHLFSQSQMSAMYDTVYRLPDNTLSPSNRNICCVMAVAAVGAQYEHSSNELRTEAAFYDIARHYFDHIVEFAELDAIKVCVMMAMYNILTRETVALTYVEIGLSLSRQLKVSKEEPKAGDELSSSVFIESKRTWRTLVFLSSWLSSTLGYISGNDLLPYENMPLTIATSDSDVVEVVQNEMTNIAVLKAKILRMHLVFKDLTILSVRSILQDLQTWYGRMPSQIRLDYEGHDQLAPLTKWSIYHVHLLYLGASILLYRRMSSQLMEEMYAATDRDGPNTALRKLFSDQGAQAVLAAKGSARIMAMLLQDCGIFKRCWLVVFQAYTSCLIVLHSAMQKLLHDWSATSWQDDLHKAKLCLDVLEYCGTADTTAQRFHEELRPVYNYMLQQESNAFIGSEPLEHNPPRGQATANEPVHFELKYEPDGSPYDTSYLISIPTNARPEHVQRSCQLLVKLCQPFGNPHDQAPRMADIKQRWHEEPTRDLHMLMMARLDWDLESRQPFVWDTKKLANCSLAQKEGSASVAGGKANGTPGLRSLGDMGGRFVGSMQPSGWENYNGTARHHQGEPENHVAVTPNEVDEMAVE